MIGDATQAGSVVQSWRGGRRRAFWASTMNDHHYAVYLQARPYWSTRFNDIHVPLAYLRGRELLLAYPQSDADIVIPAILPHDVGWMAVPEDQQGRVFGAIKDQSMLRFHETEGARIAGEIQSAVGYGMEQSAAIVTIISGHDTRLEPLSLEDSLVKDADKVWRYTPVGIEFYQRSVGNPPVEHVPWLARQIDRWFFTDRGKQMAREELSHVQPALAEIGHV